ncbi:hypothetical protein RJ639_006369 [Escallonia herrerae]|uniref:Uncharacterized protein n=1 Tax=Escallonia herrerae TaxID=1293975 RepID=A0AA89AVI6_9ASTE|nr:hypothetical protein RJ639_006369 [Escallonia herrerae]
MVMLVNHELADTNHNIHDCPEIRLHPHRWVRKPAFHIFDLAGVVIDLRLREFQPVSRADHHRAVRRTDHPTTPQLVQCREGNPCMWTYEHPRGIGLSHGVHQLLLRRLLHDPVRVLESNHRSVYGHGIADLYGRSKCRARLHWLELRPPRLVVLVQRIGVRGLCANKPRNAIDKPQFMAHFEPFIESIHIS